MNNIKKEKFCFGYIFWLKFSTLALFVFLIIIFLFPKITQAQLPEHKCCYNLTKYGSERCITKRQNDACPSTYSEGPANTPCFACLRCDCQGSGNNVPSDVTNMLPTKVGDGTIDADTKKESPTIIPELQIPIPGFSGFTKEVQICLEQGKSLEDCSENQKGYSIPWIGEYIIAFYKWAIRGIAILAVFMSMLGGLQWLLGRGNPSAIESAKSKISSSLIGVLIILTVNILLSTINPKLAIFKPIVIGQIKRIELDIDIMRNGADSDAASISGNTCVDDNQLVRINSSLFGGIGNTDGRLLPDTYNKLIEAEELAEAQNKKIYITSAFRSLSTQQNLWDDAVAKYGSEAEAAKYVARPRCGAPHLTGGAVDVCIAGARSCQKISGANARYSDSDVLFLQNIMTQVGFVRYCGEWWHFEYGTIRWQRGQGLPPGPGKCI